MSTNNDVFKVLVTDNNETVLSPGGTVDTLAPGQVGVFDRNTQLSIDGTSPVKDFYVAVGIDRDSDGTIEDINVSAGQLIQTKGIKNYSFRPHTPGRPMIFEFTDYKGSCDTEYGLRLEFRNMDIYTRQGYVQYTKPYFITTSCCDGCEGCPSGDANEISQLMAAAINADVDNFATAEIIARDVITIVLHGVSVDYAIGDVMTDADVAVVLAFNAAEADAALHVFTNLRITTAPLAIQTYCNINLGYKKPRFTIVIPSKVTGFDCGGVLTVTQTAAAEEGNGYDVKQKEYNAGAWDGNPGPYRVSPSTGTSLDVEYFADASVQYDQFVLTYDQFSVSGWLEHNNNLATIIAVPAVDVLTRDSLVAVFDAILAGSASGLHPLADDVALADVDPLVEEPTADIDDAELDGIA